MHLTLTTSRYATAAAADTVGGPTASGALQGSLQDVLQGSLQGGSPVALQGSLPGAALGGAPLPATLFLALLSGLGVGGGLALLLTSLRKRPRSAGRWRTRTTTRATVMLRRAGRRTAVAAGTALVVLLLTRWPVAGLASGALVLFWERLFGGAAAERAALRRVEALAAWTESLRDTIAGAVGLEQAVPASARAAAPELRPHLDALVDRLRARTPLPEALAVLADEIDDASADIIVAALVLNSRLRGPGLRQVLGALASSAREEVDMRQRVRAQRAATRRSVQIVVAVSVSFVLGLSVLNREFVTPYGTPFGQLVLACVCALFALGFWWLRKLSAIPVPERFLVRGEPTATAARATAGGTATATTSGITTATATATGGGDAGGVADGAAGGVASAAVGTTANTVAVPGPVERKSP